MFIKISKLGAVLKKAYKGAGIHLEKQGAKLIVGTAYMYIEADTATMTNEFKAEVIKYAGEIPVDGMAFTIAKDMVQNNIPSSYDRKLYETDLLNYPHYDETLFIYNGEPVLQGDTLITVPAKEWAVYSPAAKGGSEDDVDGWYMVDGNIVCRNSTMILALAFNKADDTLKGLQDKCLI